MIDKIETVVMDLKGLSTEKEIKTYIPRALVKFHPQPDKLMFDYVITGKGENKKGLIAYTYQTLLSNKVNIEHPILLFKSILKKDGQYIIIYRDQILEVIIEDGGTTKAEQRALRTEDLESIIGTDAIILSDVKNILYTTTLFGEGVIPIEPLYKKCRSSLFIPKKKHLLPKITIVITLLAILSITTAYLILERNKKLAKKEELRLIYNKKEEEKRVQLELENKYNTLLTELYIIESQIEPDIYSILYELNKYGSNYKITDFNYSPGSLRLNVITKNSIELLQELNISQNLELVQNIVTTRNGLEQVNITGNVVQNIGIMPRDISELKELLLKYKQMFFSSDESSVTITTPIIKNMLLNNGINITQYQSGKESVRYSINGQKSALLKFLYSLSKEEKIYRFNLISIKMVDNNNFSGVLDMTRVTLSAKQNSNNYIEELLIPQSKSPYNSNVLSPLGVGFSKPTSVVIIAKNIVEKIPELKPNIVLTKFIFIGRLTRGNSNLVVFKESNNGRIFRFKTGDISAGYKYIGEDNNKFLFEKDNIKYEVKQ